jgi:hypothetical protein
VTTPDTTRSPINDEARHDGGGSDTMTGDQTTAPVDLRLVALAPDRSHLVLEDSESRQFRVPVDGRFAAALRPVASSSSPHPGQLEIAVESQLTPREIQARIRSGHSVDEVAIAAGISADRVERYASPVIAERSHVVEQAQKAPARRATAGKAPALAEVVEQRLVEQRVAPGTAEWDAFRTDDDRWTVRLCYLAGGRSRVATWTFDARGRVLSPADDEARWLVDDAAADRLADEPPAAVRRLTSLPGGASEEEQAAASAADEVYDRERDETAAREAARRAPAADGSVGETGDGPVEVERQAAAGRHGRRPAVPSWDDIMFGTRRRD